ncbi:hypothetical protein A6R68_05301, partial [Neotoma lepida]
VQKFTLYLITHFSVIGWPSQSLRSEGLNHPFLFNYEAPAEYSATLMASWQPVPSWCKGIPRAQSPKHPLPFPIMVPLQQSLSWSLTVGTRQASTLDPKEGGEGVNVPPHSESLDVRPATACRTERDDDTPPEWGKHLTSTKDPRDFPPPGVIRLTRHKFRCQKPYEGKTFKVHDSWTADSLQSLRALIKSTPSQKTLDPIKEPKENKEGKVPLPQEVPECRSNPLSTAPRPSALQPATRKRVASSLGPIPGKVKRSLTMSTVLEDPMDFDKSGTRVTATSSEHCAGDASEKFKEDDT